MTREHITDFASELVQMAMATKRVPELERELAEAQREVSRQADRIATMEVVSIHRSQEIERLHATIRSLEVARDDAELRFLEAEDKLGGFVRLVKGFASDAGALVKAIEPEPVTEPQRPLDDGSSSASQQADQPSTGLPSSSEGIGDEEVIGTRPFEGSGIAHIEGSPQSQEADGGVSTAERPSTEGQSEPNPTATSTEPTGQPSDVGSSHAEPQAGAHGDGYGEAGEANGPFASSSPSAESPTAGVGASEPADGTVERKTITTEEAFHAKLGPKPDQPDGWWDQFSSASHRSS